MNVGAHNRRRNRAGRMAKSEVEQAGLRELIAWPGVTWRAVYAGKHIKLHLTYEGRTRFVVRSRTLSDARGVRNHVGDIKRTLRLLGATRKG